MHFNLLWQCLSSWEVPCWVASAPWLSRTLISCTIWWLAIEMRWKVQIDHHLWSTWSNNIKALVARYKFYKSNPTDICKRLSCEFNKQNGRTPEKESQIPVRNGRCEHPRWLSTKYLINWSISSNSGKETRTKSKYQSHGSCSAQ